MEFARKQLEKYGWSDGKGLGKHENGISEALKPKLKRSVTGVGHDPASEFNEHWWSALYDKAAKNVEVEEKNGKTKKIRTKEDIVISSSTWKINKKPSKQTDEAQYSEYFVRTAVLTNDRGGRKTENVKDSESEEEADKKHVLKMTDEELFAACEGRTAHKGARHGLRATGKLARIAEQEQKLLTLPQYEGYSHAKRLKQKAEECIDEMSIKEETSEPQKKKKKRKRCTINDIQLVESISSLPLLPEKLKSKNGDASDKINEENGSNSDVQMTVDCDVKKSKKKKKRKIDNQQADNLELMDSHNDNNDVSESKIKKKKKKVKDEQMDC